MSKNIRVKLNKNESLPKRENIKIKINRDNNPKKMQWGDAEREELESRIASLKDNPADDKLLAKAAKIAEKIKRSELVLFWLQNAAEKSEKYFDAWLEDIQSFSKQELIDIMHELGSEALKKFVKTFEKANKQTAKTPN